MKILHIIPYRHLYPPKNGGQLRCFHILDQLSKYYKVDVICYQTKESIYKRGFVNSNVTFYSPSSFAKSKTILSSVLPKKVYNAGLSRLLSKNFFEPAVEEVIEFQHLIKNLVSNDYNYIVLEHIRTLSLAPVLNKYFPNSHRILNAHNVDHLLLDSKDPNYAKVLEKERKLYKRVHSFWACSKKDKNILETLNDKKIKGYVIPNGVEIDDTFEKNLTESNNKKLLFCGSLDYYPNKNGLLWFYSNVWSVLKEKINGVELTIIGRGSTEGYTALNDDEQINFIGEVDDVKPYYKSNPIAIVPIFEGSGTRLKVLEAMSYKTAMVTTSKGIEGIDYKDKIHAITANDTNEFIIGISSLMENKELRKKVVDNARILVKSNYSWNVVGEKICKHLNG
ncbi:glycosyltransferase family 4 protein [Winogradskyella flava]|uniref:glycosyltransferase family 4 protein n=1 Tax=Winogradskyella flava TaxID=1884876 RepID=UPI002491181A|nr:glycosyltransferase family 4 protein [Winogradskyella flava]